MEKGVKATGRGIVYLGRKTKEGAKYVYGASKRKINAFKEKRELAKLRESVAAPAVVAPAVVAPAVVAPAAHRRSVEPAPSGSPRKSLFERFK